MFVTKARKYYMEHDFNCSESILYAANEHYDLGIDPKGLKIMAAFGGGMGIESVCGAVTGSIAALSVMFCENKAHDNPELKEICKSYFAEFEKRYHSTICLELKEKYRTEEEKCLKVIEMAAEVLEKVIEARRGNVTENEV